MDTSVNHYRLDNILNDFAFQTTQKIQRLEETQLFDAASQMLPPKSFQP